GWASVLRRRAYCGMAGIHGRRSGYGLRRRGCDRKGFQGLRCLRAHLGFEFTSERRLTKASLATSDLYTSYKRICVRPKSTRPIPIRNGREIRPSSSEPIVTPRIPNPALTKAAAKGAAQSGR